MTDNYCMTGYKWEYITNIGSQALFIINASASRLERPKVVKDEVLNFDISLNIFVFEACQEWQIKYPALVTVRDDVSCGGNVGGDQSLEGHYPWYYPHAPTATATHVLAAGPSFQIDNVLSI